VSNEKDLETVTVQHYQKHIFLCNNQKLNGKKCCADKGATDKAKYLKELLIEKGLHGIDKCRVSTSGCLGRCSKGPCLVIYPEGVWYSYSDIEDINERIDSHLIKGEVVSKLLIK
jgi:(2Fe-2S) ferredoxin